MSAVRQRKGAAGADGSDDHAGPKKPELVRKATMMGDSMYRIGQKDWKYNSIICGVSYFNEGPLDRARFIELIKDRLSLYPRFRSVLNKRGAAFYWEEVKELDYSYHVVDTTLPGEAGQLEMDDFVSQKIAEPLDRRQPLFRFFIVRNFKRTQGALVTIIHHSIGDGTTLVEVFFSLTDAQLGTTTGGKPASGVAYKKKPPPLYKQLSPINVGSRLWMLLRDAAYGLSLPFGVYDTKTQLLLGDSTKLSERRYCAFSQKIPLEAVKEIKASFGGTINDVVIALVAGMCRRYLEKNNDPHLARGQQVRLRALFPANMRKPTADVRQEEFFGNQFSFVPITLPLNERDPVKLLQQSKMLADDLKVSSVVPVMMGTNKLLVKILPHSLYRLITFGIFDRISCLFTNVPGPREKVSMAGREVDDIMFYVSAMIALVISVISYNGEISVGVLADPKVVQNPADICQCFEEELQALREATRGKQFGMPSRLAERTRDCVCLALFLLLVYLLYTRALF